MKTIVYPELKSLQFAEQLASIIRVAPPEGGYSIDDVRNGLKVLDKLEKADGRIELEDAEYVWVKHRVSNVRWRTADADVVAFVDAVNAAA